MSYMFNKCQSVGVSTCDGRGHNNQTKIWGSIRDFLESRLRSWIYHFATDNHPCTPHWMAGSLHFKFDF